MKSIIKDDLMSYVCNSNIITSLQHGFLPRRSCHSNLLIMLNCLTEAIDRGSITLANKDFVAMQLVTVSYGFCGAKFKNHISFC